MDRHPLDRPRLHRLAPSDTTPTACWPGTRPHAPRKHCSTCAPAGSKGPGVGFDEFFDLTGQVRPAWTELADAVAERGRAGLNRLRSVVNSLIDNDGITYTEVAADREGPAGASKLRAWNRGLGAWTPCLSSFRRRLGSAGGRTGPAVPRARCRTRGSLRAA